MDKTTVLLFVGALVVLSAILALNAWLDATLFGSKIAPLSVAVMVGALVVLKAYEVWKR